MVTEDTTALTSENVFLDTLREALKRRGYEGEALEAKIRELQAKDYPRLAQVLAQEVEES